MRKWVGLLFIILCCVLATPVMASEYYSFGLTDTGVRGGTADLYEEPDEASALIGSYYSGITLHVFEQMDGWARVRIYNDDGQIGYMRMEMVSEMDNGSRYSHPIAEVTGDTPVPVLAQPDEGADVLGHYLPGTKVELFAEAGAYRHVFATPVNGYIATDSLMKTGEDVPYFRSVPDVGIAVARDGLPVLGAWGSYIPLHQYPEESSVYNGDISPGSPMQLIADLGDWCQVYLHSTFSFVMKGQVDLYEWADLMPKTEAFSVSPGEYVVGKDLPSQLYTLTGGEIAVIPAAGNAWQYSAAENTEYTVYLPEGARVALTGTLQSFSAKPAISAENGWQYKQDGRLLSGVEFHAPHDAALKITLRDGEGAGYYEIVGIAGDDGKEVTRQRVEVVAGETYYVYVDKGSFIELHNCVARYFYGNG